MAMLCSNLPPVLSAIAAPCEWIASGNQSFFESRVSSYFVPSPGAPCELIVTTPSGFAPGAFALRRAKAVSATPLEVLLRGGREEVEGRRRALRERLRRRVLRVETERIGIGNKSNITPAKLAVRSGQMKIPIELLAYRESNLSGSEVDRAWPNLQQLRVGKGGLPPLFRSPHLSLGFNSSILHNQASILIQVARCTIL